jgi:hypothetical protein
MRRPIHLILGMIISISLLVPAGSMAASTQAAATPAKAANLRLTDLPAGFVRGINGITSHDDTSAQHKAASSADDADYYWKTASGDRSVEVSTTVEYYKVHADAVKYLPANALALFQSAIAKEPKALQGKISACAIGEVCVFVSQVFYKSPIGAMQFRHLNYLVSLQVVETGARLPVPATQVFASSLAKSIVSHIDSIRR